MGHGGVERNSSFMVSGARVFLKYCSIILIFYDVDPGTLSSSSLTVIYRFQNYEFFHNFLSHETLELLEILNSSKRLTNLKCNEDRFSKFEYLHFLRPFFDFFVVFSVFYENFSYLKT